MLQEMAGLAFITMLTAICGLARADIYVSTTGNDSNSGGKELPFRTLERGRNEDPQVQKNRGTSGRGRRRRTPRRRLRTGRAVEALGRRFRRSGLADNLAGPARRRGPPGGRRPGEELPAGHRSGGAEAARRIGPRQSAPGRSEGAGRQGLRPGRRRQPPGGVLPGQAHDPGPLAQRGLRPHRRPGGRRPHRDPRHARRQDRPLHLRGRPAQALGRREGRLAPRLLVLGLGRPAPAGRVDRHGPARHRARAALPRLRLPQGPVVLRAEPAARTGRAGRMVSGPAVGHPLLLAARAARPGQGRWCR